MCNQCMCENYDRCSIVGYMPRGFCCSKCDFYSEENKCSRLKATIKVLTKNVELYQE
ncbi:MAG: hypothetical protein ACTSQJ_01610 [Promethearchaeota archaeon]